MNRKYSTLYHSITLATTCLPIRLCPKSKSSIKAWKRPNVCSQSVQQLFGFGEA